MSSITRGDNENDTKTRHPKNQDEPVAQTSQRRQQELQTHERENAGMVIRSWERLEYQPSGSEETWEVIQTVFEMNEGYER